MGTGAKMTRSYPPTIPLIDDKKGMRIYDNGRDKEDRRRCIVAVTDAFIQPRATHQCKKKRGHGTDGLLCKAHARYFEVIPPSEPRP